MRTRWILVVALLAAVFARLGEANGPEKPPNIVLIVLDDLGFEVLDFWPYQPFPPGVMGDPPTPALKSLADGGIVFTNAWASPVCSPSRMQILTGRHAHRTGVGGLVGRDADLRIDDAELFLPEVIKANMNPSGYHAGAFGKWHIAPLRSPDGTCNLDHAIRNGFDIFQGHMWNVTRLDPLTTNHFNWDYVDSTTPLDCNNLLPEVTEWSAKVTRRDALDWITGLPPDEPFFAYVAFNAPHTPLQVPPLDPPGPGGQPVSLSNATLSYIGGLTNPATGAPYMAGQSPGADPDRHCAGDPLAPPGYDYVQNFGRHVEVFNWMVEAVDTEIGKILRRLANLGRLQDTVIFVVSDNGTSGVSLDCPLNTEHAKTSVYQLGTRVPLIVWGPRVISPANAGSVCDELVAAVDLWPTIAETAGVVSPAQHLAPGYTLDGKSFSHLIADPSAASPRSHALIEYFTGHKRHHGVEPDGGPATRFKRSVVDASGYRYVQHFWQGTLPPGNAADEFLHIPSDPDETIDLAGFGLPMQGRSPCPPNACPGQIQELGELLKVSCVMTTPPSPPCDLMILFDLFNGFYGPLLCPCLTTN